MDRMDRPNGEHDLHGLPFLGTPHAVGKEAYIFPSRNRTITMTTTNPSPPLGPYPHDLLWGHVGIAPINSRIKTINRIVPNDISFSSG